MTKPPFYPSAIRGKDYALVHDVVILYSLEKINTDVISPLVMSEFYLSIKPPRCTTGWFVLDWSG